MILRVDTETREAQTHAIGIIANLRSKLWTGEIPHSSGHTHRQTNNIDTYSSRGNLSRQTNGQPHRIPDTTAHPCGERVRVTKCPVTTIYSLTASDTVLRDLSLVQMCAHMPMEVVTSQL